MSAVLSDQQKKNGEKEAWGALSNITDGPRREL